MMMVLNLSNLSKETALNNEKGEKGVCKSTKSFNWGWSESEPPKKREKKKRQSLKNFKEAGEDQERKNNEHIANQVDIYTIYSATFRLGCGIDINLNLSIPSDYLKNVLSLCNLLVLVAVTIGENCILAPLAVIVVVGSKTPRVLRKKPAIYRDHTIAASPTFDDSEKKRLQLAGLNLQILMITFK